MVGLTDPIDVQAKYLTFTFAVGRGATVGPTACVVGNRWLDNLDIFWAPGHVGLVGVRVAYQTVTMLPWNNPSGLLFGSNERRLFEMGLQVTNSFTVTVVNNDAKFAHTVQITAKVHELHGAPQPQPTDLIAIGDLNA